MKKIINLIDKISYIGGIASGAMIIIGLILVVIEIILRSLFSKTLFVTEEYSGYLMAGITFLALSYTLKEKGHIRMTFLHTILSERGKIILDMIAYTIGFIFSIILTYYTFLFFWDSLVSNSRSMQISQTPLAIPQFFLPVGSAMFALQFFAEFFKDYYTLKEGKINAIKEESKELGR